MEDYSRVEININKICIMRKSTNEMRQINLLNIII